MSEQKQRDLDLINRRNLFIGAGLLAAGANANAAISATDVTGAYTAAGAEDTVDGVGVLIIGLAIGVMIVGLIVGLVKKK
jgi:F0F1-type ATP synthase membrane subunit c/vacuolar-type H+-ATPase subunit K